MSSASASNPSLGGCLRAARNPRLRKIPVQTLSSRLASLPSPRIRRTYLKPRARAQFKLNPDPQLRGAGPGRGRASRASDSGPLGREVGGGRRDRLGPRGGSRPSLCHQAVVAETGSGRSPFGRGCLPGLLHAPLRTRGASLLERSNREGQWGLERLAGSARK